MEKDIEEDIIEKDDAKFNDANEFKKKRIQC